MKFRDSVEQVTFSGARAARLGQPVLYVTERCVFELTPDGLALAEIAPAIDLERDILSQMAFRPIVGELREMDGRIFRDEPMRSAHRPPEARPAARVALDRDCNRLFLNFENMRVRSGQGRRAASAPRWSGSARRSATRRRRRQHEVEFASSRGCPI